MAIYLHIIGRAIWGLSCLFVALFLLIYDGAIQGNRQVVSTLFAIFLFLQTIVAAKFILYFYIAGTLMSYFVAALLSLAGTMYPIIATILMLSPSHRNKEMRIIIMCVIPFIYISFLVALVFIPEELRTIAALIYYVPCAIIAFLTVITLYRWYKTERFIFAIYTPNSDGRERCLHNMANWDLLFKLAIFGIIVTFVANFIYPLIVFYGDLQDDYHHFVIALVDSLLFLPSVTPLIRNLDKVVDYSKYRVLQSDEIDMAFKQLPDN